MKYILIAMMLMIARTTKAQRVRSEGVQLSLQKVEVVSDTLMQFLFTIENHSAVLYQPAFIHFALHDRNISKRTASQETELLPTAGANTFILRGDSSRSLIVSFKPFMIPKKKYMIVSMAEENGARAIALKIRSKAILKARRTE